jgi:hypothetical protein
MKKNLGFSAFKESKIPTSQLTVDGFAAVDKKRFTEALHARKPDGQFEPSSERGLTRRKLLEEERTSHKNEPYGQHDSAEGLDEAEDSANPPFPKRIHALKLGR